MKPQLLLGMILYYCREFAMFWNQIVLLLCTDLMTTMFTGKLHGELNRGL